MNTSVAISAALVLLTASSAANAWGAEGHRLIAEVAESQLTPAARSEVARLLSGEPGATLQSVSTWADEVRSQATAPWHYVNPPPGECSYDRERDCDNGQCAVEALNRQVVVLKSKAPDSERLVALKWVVHLVGDVHQPLHAGFKDDKGGNLFQVQAFGRGTNLHSLWDGGLIRNRAGGLDALRSETAATAVAAAVPPQPAAWAVESCKVVLSPGFYPEGRFIEPGYAAQWDPVLVARLRLAAQRLASTLNDALR
ncbi:MAG: S1/P1 nuclease [Burkholderiales bacterium]|nr:S1/P1 nuclease [Burkholderiales bacterium]